MNTHIIKPSNLPTYQVGQTVTHPQHGAVRLTKVDTKPVAEPGTGRHVPAAVKLHGAADSGPVIFTPAELTGRTQNEEA